MTFFGWWTKCSQICWMQVCFDCMKQDFPVTSLWRGTSWISLQDRKRNPSLLGQVCWMVNPIHAENEVNRKWRLEISWILQDLFFPIRSNWLAQAFFCVTQSCCHARYQLRHREYYGIFLFLYVRKIARSYAPLRFWVGCGWAFVSMALSCLRWLLGSMSLPCSTTWVWCSYRTSCPWRIQEVEFWGGLADLGRTCRDEVKWSTHSEYKLIKNIHVTYDLCWKFVSTILKHTQLFHLPFFESRSVMLCRMLGPFSWIRNFLTAGTTQIRRHLTLTRRDRRHRPETFASQDSGLRLVGLLRLLA